MNVGERLSLMQPFSPSSLKTFVQCPYKFKAQYIDKSVKFVQSAAAARGERLHELMEKAINEGWDAVVWDDEQSRPNAERFIQGFAALKQNGWELYTEVATATHGTDIADFWDKTTIIRCRIDVYAVHPDSDTVLVFDHKTGRKYDTDKLQLQLNAVCLQPITGRSKYLVAFDYLDSGDVAEQFIDVSGVNLAKTDAADIAASPCPEFLSALSRAITAAFTGDFPRTTNRFCSWCQVADCPHAGGK